MGPKPITATQDDVKLVIYDRTDGWPQWDLRHRRGISAICTMPLDVDTTKKVLKGRPRAPSKLRNCKLELVWIHFEDKLRSGGISTSDSAAQLRLEYERGGYTIYKEGLPRCRDPTDALLRQIISLAPALGDERVNVLLRVLSREYCALVLKQDEQRQLREIWEKYRRRPLHWPTLT